MPRPKPRPDRIVGHLVAVGVAVAIAATCGAVDSLPVIGVVAWLVPATWRVLCGVSRRACAGAVADVVAQHLGRVARGVASAASFLRHGFRRIAWALLLAELAVAGSVWRSRAPSPNGTSHDTVCGNHLDLHRSVLRAYVQRGPERFPLDEDPLAALDALFTSAGHGGRRPWLDGGGGECAGCRGVGFVWVGAGLPVRLAEREDALLYVCPALNAAAQNHVHALSARSGLACLSGVAAAERLERAIAQGESGRLPYTAEALVRLRHERDARRRHERPWYRQWW